MKKSLMATLFWFGVASCLIAADWPQWRGPERNGISMEKGLLSAWPADGPTLRWKRTDLGIGYSSPAISKGVIYIQSTNGNAEVTLALSEQTGETLWSKEIGKVGVNKGPQYPGTRATPTVDGDRVYSLASDGELNCLATTDGKVIWHLNLAKQFDGQVGSWAYTESVLIDGDDLVCTPGGEQATLAKLNKKTGTVVWKSAVPGGDIADYASIMIVQVGGKKQYVQYLRKAVVGVDAKTGAFLWKNSSTQDQGASILTPVVSGNLVFVSGSRKGGALIELTPSGDGVTAKEVYFDKSLAPSLGGAILYEGHLYGSAGTTVFCADFKTGKVKWTDPSVGPASICMAEGKLYVRGYNSGAVALVEASPTEYKEISRFKQPNKSKTQGWPHPVVANGNFYIRDMDVLLCYDVKGK
jgi:outer membrane protein assembly factor BamB